MQYTREMFEHYMQRERGSRIQNFWYELKEGVSMASPLILIGGLFLILVWWLLHPIGVTNSDFARLMRQEGIIHVESRAVMLSSCGHGDLIATGFVGIKNGQPVKGVICGGPFKSYTIRYD